MILISLIVSQDDRTITDIVEVIYPMDTPSDYLNIECTPEQKDARDAERRSLAAEKIVSKLTFRFKDEVSLGQIVAHTLYRS